jgi:hypothetical protein
MKIPVEDWFFLLGLSLVTGLVIYHIDQAGTVAMLVGAHKGISVADTKFKDTPQNSDPQAREV